MTGVDADFQNEGHIIAKIAETDIGIGRTFHQLHKHDLADASYLKARQKAKKLVSAEPDNPEWIRLQLDADRMYAISLDTQGESKKAQKLFQKCIKLGKRLVDLDSQPRYKASYASVLINLGLQKIGRGPEERAEARKNWLDAASILEGIAKTDRTETMEQALAGVYMNLAIAFKPEPDKEMTFRRKAVESFKALSSKYPDNVNYRAEYVKSTTNLAKALFDRELFDGEVEQLLADITPIAVELSSEHRDIPKCQDALAHVFEKTKVMLFNRGMYDDALAAAKKEVKVRKQLVALAPDTASYEANLCRSILLQSVAAIEAKDYELVLRSAYEVYVRVAGQTSARADNYRNRAKDRVKTIRSRLDSEIETMYSISQAQQLADLFAAFARLTGSHGSHWFASRLYLQSGNQGKSLENIQQAIQLAPSDEKSEYVDFRNSLEQSVRK